MAVRLSGLNSGMDTDSIVTALMKAKTAKKTKIENKKQKLEWKQDIWKDLNTKIYNFYKDSASKLRLQTNYSTRKASSSDTSKVTATATNGASAGSYSVKVNKLASGQYVTGGKIGSYTTVDENGETVTKQVTGSTKLSDLGFASDGSNQINISTGSKNVSVNIDGNTTINDFVSTLKDAGLNASFDAKQGRFFISSKESGENQKFTITANQLSSGATTAQNAIKDIAGFDSLSSAQKNTVKSVINNLQNSTAADKVDKATASLISVMDADAKTKATNYYTNQVREGYTSQYINSETDEDGKVTETLTDAGIEALKEAGKYKEPAEDADEAAIKKNQEENLKAMKSLITTKTNADMKSEEYQGKITDAIENGLEAEGISIADKASRDGNIATAVSNYASEIATGSSEVTGADPLAALGLGKITGDAMKESDSANGMVVLAAGDTEVEFNGATLKSSNTSLEVNGLTLNLTGTTDEAVTVTVANDPEGTYDMIKDFVNQYNSLLTELNGKYNAASAKNYDVLSSEQKEAMSDSEIDKWEDTIKKSLLRRDSTLDGILQTMRSSMTNFTVKASNGKNYSLANLGISLGSDYKEYGLLHIKGDEDDAEYADSTNTLKNLINEDPDVVTEVLSGIVSNLYSNLSSKMKATTLSSALTFYNDKEIKKQLDTYKDNISDWEERLANTEKRYYSQFTAMEKNMSKLNSTQSSISSYFG